MPVLPWAVCASTSNAASIDPSAVEALTDVENRIRTKLAELADLTMRPASKRRHLDDEGCTSRTSGGGGVASTAAMVRKRTHGPGLLLASPAAETEQPNWRVDRHGLNDAGSVAAAASHQQRAREEAALHFEVLAVLGARKRYVRGAVGEARQFDRGQQRSSSIGEGGGLHLPAAAGPLTIGGSGGDGAVPAERQDVLRAELLAIDGMIKARVRGAGGDAMTRRL